MLKNDKLVNNNLVAVLDYTYSKPDGLPFEERKERNKKQAL